MAQHLAVYRYIHTVLDEYIYLHTILDVFDIHSVYIVLDVFDIRTIVHTVFRYINTDMQYLISIHTVLDVYIYIYICSTYSMYICQQCMYRRIHTIYSYILYYT